ncbi:lantibiotic dehydratase [Hymenobacter algoricola]|uniref:Lantibiotic dehydratase n=1 Tax=Hymenobacter algoricola TaxID=486267 RepID=A0ABP7NQW0_9BACT
MNLLYEFHPQLILRTPTQPFRIDFDEAVIRASLDQVGFMEAVYLASPALHEECRKWQRGELTDARKIEKLQATLTRYHVRSTSRCTPFGLFAGCAVVDWGPESNIEVNPARAARHTRLDMHYLCALAKHLAAHESIRPRLRYWPNTSLYHTGEEVRYVEYHYAGGSRVHQISAVEASPYLLQVLAAAQGGQDYTSLVALLGAEEADAAEAAEFIDALIQNQLLVHELEPTVTGEEFFYRIQAVLDRVATAGADPAVASLAQVLRRAGQQLQALDQTRANRAADYEQIVATLAPLGVAPEAGKLFQTDAIQGLTAGRSTLASGLQDELIEALEVLMQLTPAHQNPRLEDFRRRFQDRYEDQEVPLLAALDNESGLSYTDYGKSSYSPLVHDLAVAGGGTKSRELRQTEVQQYLYQKLRQAERGRLYSLDITKEELSRFRPGHQPLPPSLSVMFRIIDAERVLLESVGGSSAVNLLGRFAHADPAIARLIEQVARQEQEQNPAVGFAEICHLPASRIGNILLRPAFRNLEIPYLAQAGQPEEGQVQVQDLVLAVRGGQLVLRSRKTGQRIIPRLSTAHNFSREALPVYQFLCDLQTQGLQPHLGFSWQSISLYAKFLPRLTYGKVVLEPASWQFGPEDLQALLAAPAAEVEQVLQQFRQQWQLPRLFTLADGDNHLLVDAENTLLVRVWLDTIRNRSSVSLREFLVEPAQSPVRDAAGRPYAQQFIALLQRQGPCYASPGQPVPMKKKPAEAPQRDFSLGSEWLYYKLYCGQKVADRILAEAIRPLLAELHEQQLIDGWFFIRYADPDNHLRVRFHLPRPGCLGQVVELVSAYLQPLIASGAIWKMQTDTYRRELERYGCTTIGVAEALFCQQSTAVLDMLAEQEEGAESWLWGLGAMDELLRAFAYSVEEKEALLRRLKDSFGREFGLDANKGLKLQLDAKYRALRPAVRQALDQAEKTSVAPPLRALARQIEQAEQAGQLDVEKDQLLGSYLHMLLNRVLPAEARLHELVLYDFLARHYQSQLAMLKKA